MGDRTCLSIILAAGDGTRMRSRRSKVLHEVAGLSMVGHVARTAVAAGSGDLAAIVGRDGDLVKAEIERFSPETQTFEQTERLGTAHALLCARQAMEQGYDDILVLFGDTPLVTPETLSKARGELARGSDVVVMGFMAADPTGYGRLIERNGQLIAIREHKDASEDIRRIRFCNGGMMALNGHKALRYLDQIGNNNAKGEYYLTDIVEIAAGDEGRVVALEVPETEVIGVNTRVELAHVEQLWQQRQRQALMLAGVSMQAPETVFLAYDTEIGAETILEPNIVFGPGARIEGGATIHAFSHIEGATIATGATVGPFARLRPGADLAQGSKVGNFCEVKKATVGAGAKVNHLTYIGDARIGERANIGAGTITCNYDGFNKHKTEIGAGAFIGSNSALVAPVRIGAGAYVGSGSVITDNVADDALAIGRGRQVEKAGMGAALRERFAAQKAAAKKN